MKKLAKKILAICLSAVMAGSLLSAVAFATTAEAVSVEKFGITTFASDAADIVITKDQTKADWTVSGDVYIPQGITLTLAGTTTISGNVYVFGTLINRGELTVTGTLHCLNYTWGTVHGSAGNYNYGYFIDAGQTRAHVLDVMPEWLEDTVIPETPDDDDSEADIPSDTHVTVINDEETFTDKEITGDVVIPKDTTLNTSGDVTISGDVYVLGTLTNTGTLNITGTLYCLNYNSKMSVGDYDYGYVYNENVLDAHDLIVDDGYLSIDFPASTVHTWDSGEVLSDATCTEPGEVQYVCSGCGETKIESIPAGHTWGDDIEWTWSEDYSSATATRTCSVCGETETVEATVTKEVTVEPTETEEGEVEYTATAIFDDGTTITDSVTDIYTLADKEKDEGNNNNDNDNNNDNNGNSNTNTGTGSTGTGSSGTNGTSGSSGTGSTVTSPQTDDPTNTTALWITVVCFGLAGCVALAVYKVHGTKEQD